MSDNVHKLLLAALSRPERIELAGRMGTDTWRLVNGAGDGMSGFTVDLFEGSILIEQHAEGLNPGPLIDALSHAYGLEAPIFLKERWSPSAPGWQGRQVCGPPSASDLVVSESDLSFTVSLCGQEHVGLFLDTRPARERVRDISSGRRVLNLFSYTGAFGSSLQLPSILYLLFISSLKLNSYSVLLVVLLFYNICYCSTFI